LFLVVPWKSFFQPDVCLGTTFSLIFRFPSSFQKTVRTIEEIKDNENRVGIIPSTVKALTENGHQVLIEANAGVGSSIADADYVLAGATIVLTVKETRAAELVIKVK
jgi:hypothetical protein